MTRYILIVIIGFLALTFLITFLKGALRRMMNLGQTSPETASARDSTKTIRKQRDHIAGKELYRKKGVVVLQGEAPSDQEKLQQERLQQKKP